MLFACTSLVSLGTSRLIKALCAQPGLVPAFTHFQHYPLSSLKRFRPKIPRHAFGKHVGSGVISSATNDDTKAAQALFFKRSNFCRLCGESMHVQIPKGESEQRHVCSSCGYIDYFNPKMVVGCIVEHEGKILLCKRGIEPCKGLWTIPAGYMELTESSADGARRETWEEAEAKVAVLAPYAHFDIPIIGQAYILFRAKLLAPYTFGCGPETLETLLFSPDDIPFDQLAFSSVTLALRLYVEDMAKGSFHIHHGVVKKIPGTAPNDPRNFELIEHMQIPTCSTTAL